MIEPKIPKGFRDTLPQDELKRKFLIEKLEKQFQRFGFMPIDTPVLEYQEVLLGKGGGETDKQIFHFKDNGGRDVALRFDLTVPLARFVALHQNEIAFPFKRYCIDKVWRGEKPQKGRYREFYQCDFDIVGSSSVLSDFEIISLMESCLKSLEVGTFKILISHRGLLNDFLKKNELDSQNEDILRILDKIKKVGKKEIELMLAKEGLSQEKIEKLMQFINPNTNGFINRILEIEKLIGGETESSIRMKEIYKLLEKTGISDNVIFDPSITRGLDYYTAVVFETYLDDCPEIGSVCSGGRYDNLTALYSKQHYAGVGSCVGIDRLIAALDSKELNDAPSAQAIIFSDESLETERALVASLLRNSGIKTDIYLDDKKMKQQYKYAQVNNIKYSITKISNNKLTLKNLSSREIFSDITTNKAIEIILENN